MGEAPKEKSEALEAEVALRQKRFIRIIGPAVFFNVTSAAMMFTAR